MTNAAWPIPILSDETGRRTAERPVALESVATDDLLAAIDGRALWLAIRMVHEANHIRESSDGLKVGGHQASSASSVSILVELFFRWLNGADLVSIKPHASPAYHAVRCLLGELDERYLPSLRSIDGLQAYPSRTKDPVRVDFSTGSVGVGAVAPLFAALVDRYVEHHFNEDAHAGHAERRRFVALLGDAELDEGNVWEAVLDRSTTGLANVTFIVDVNRQSLDRVVPGRPAERATALFRAAGWHVVEARYGRRLEGLFARPGGQALRTVMDHLENDAFLDLLHTDGAELCDRLLEQVPSRERSPLAATLGSVPDAELAAIVSDVGGHDHASLRHALWQVDQEKERPSVVLAHTIKGWRLPFAAGRLNHSALLSPEQVERLARTLAADANDPWAGFPPGTAEAELCRARARDLAWAPPDAAAARRALPHPPEAVEMRETPRASTQRAFSDALASLARQPIGARIVTASPDVAISTGLGGWINRCGSFGLESFVSGDPASPLSWRTGPHGRHLELGIAEMNLFSWLGQAGLSAELFGEALIPVGTVYDPFICRGLDALVHALYGGGRFIVVGTPSGVSLAPEGGAHQSTVTASLGVELPGLRSYEPAFAQEAVWFLLEAMRGCVAPEDGFSTYLRLSTRPVDQSIVEPMVASRGTTDWRRRALAGGYVLKSAGDDGPTTRPQVRLVAMGAVVTEAVAANELLATAGIDADVVVVTSAERLATAMHDRAGVPPPQRRPDILDELFGRETAGVPIVTVADAAPHVLSFVGSLSGSRVSPLGVNGFGRSGSLPDVYSAMGIDAATVFEVAAAAVEELVARP